MQAPSATALPTLARAQPPPVLSIDMRPPCEVVRSPPVTEGEMRATKRGALALVVVGAGFVACVSNIDTPSQDPIEVGVVAGNVDSPVDAAASSDGQTFYYL